jgi:4-O-beta-D-mannosyl-D-glucose phosphorylase
MGNHQRLINKPNHADTQNSGLISRYKHPIISIEHILINWRYDLNAKSNPFGLERIGVYAAFNAGTIIWNEKYTLVIKIEGSDRRFHF